MYLQRNAKEFIFAETSYQEECWIPFFDNIGIGHLSQKVKLVPSLELFQYNRWAIKNLL